MVYWDPGILLARQSNVNNFSSLHQAKQHRCQPLHEECLFCSTFPYHSQPKPPPPLTTQPSPWSYPCISGVPVHMTTSTLSIEEQLLECNALLELAVGQGPVLSIICYFLLELTRFKFWFWKVIKIWSVINGFDMNWNGSRSFPKNEEKDSVGMICL